MMDGNSIPLSDLQQQGLINKPLAPPEIRNHERRLRASLKQRLTPLLLICLSTAFSIVPAALDWEGKLFGSHTSLYTFTTQDRATLQVVVQIIAAILAFFWTYAICSAFNLYMRNLLAEQRISVDLLRLYVSLSRKAFDINLPARLLLISGLFYGLMLFPNWIWVGALTPQTVNFSTDWNSSIVVPTTGSGSYPFLQDPGTNVVSAGCMRAPQINGTFTDCPGGTYPGHIIDSLAHVSTVGGTAWNHSKFDTAGYTYVNRSYGVGSSVGLLQTPPQVGTVVTYNFTELGYEVHASCIYNQSANWTISASLTKDQLGIPNVFYAQGLRPNDDWSTGTATSGYAVINYGLTPDEVVAFAAGGCCNFNNGTAPYFLSVAAGTHYGILDRVQCEISFQPSQFNVIVSPNNRTIQVQPGGNSSQDPEPRGQFREWTLRQLQAMAQTETTLYVSTIGEALGTNIIGYMQNSTMSLFDHVPDALPAIEASVEAALDEIMVGISGFALTQSGNYTLANATFHTTTMQIGARKFTVTVFVINVVALIAIIAITIFSRLFAKSPAFDFSNMGGMLTGTANGFVTFINDSLRSGLADWTGNPSDSVVGKSSVQLHCELDQTRGAYTEIGQPVARQ